MKQDMPHNDCEIISSSIKYLGLNAILYAVWAERCMPYNTDLGRALADLSEDEMLSQQKLKDIYLKRYHSEFNISEGEVDRVYDESSLGMERFFVLNEEMQKIIIQAALKSSFDTLSFFQRAQHDLSDTTIRQVFSSQTEYEKQHLEELKQSVEHEFAVAS